MNVPLRPLTVLPLLALALAARAQTLIDFESVSTTPSAASVPGGYAGFAWSNVDVSNKNDHTVFGTGYVTGAVSGNYVAYNPYSLPGSLSTPSLAATIAGFSGYFTSAFSSADTVVLTGLRNGLVVGTFSGTIRNSGPTFYAFGFASPVDTLTFVGNGGAGGGSQVVMDDLTINPTPEPATVAALGLGALATFRRRERAQMTRAPGADVCTGG